VNSPSSANSLQKFLATAALFLLPFPALNFGISFTVADVFLVAAVLLNGHRLVQLQGFQIPFLLALPLFVLSTLFDPDGGMIQLIQVFYIWGFVLPFGWVAFVDLPIRRIAVVVLASAVTNSLIAIGQGAGYLPELGNQHVIEFSGGFSRAAGLCLKCNSLVMSLTPCLLLIPCLLKSSTRVGVMLVLILGLLMAVSKSIIFAVPGLLWCLWHEPRRRQFVLWLVVLGLCWTMASEGTGGVADLWHRFSDLVAKRMDRVEDSIEHRIALIDVSMNYASDVLLLGYGPAGAHARVSEMTNNTVHVYYLGVILAGGLPAASLCFLGMGMVVRGLWKHQQQHTAAYVLAHLLGLTVMTSLLVSFQALPVVVGGAILARVSLTVPAGLVRPAWSPPMSSLTWSTHR
jgi:hypothetical protein